MGEKGNDSTVQRATGPDAPSTRERPGTGTPDPKPEQPPEQKPPERASGQITDEKGEYGPVRYSEPGSRANQPGRKSS